MSLKLGQKRSTEELHKKVIGEIVGPNPHIITLSRDEVLRLDSFLRWFRKIAPNVKHGSIRDILEDKVREALTGKGVGGEDVFAAISYDIQEAHEEENELDTEPD